MPFVREARSAGRTKYTLRAMLRFSFDAITSFSQPRRCSWRRSSASSSRVLAFLAIPLTVVARYANIYERGVPTTIVDRAAARRHPADHASGSSASTSGRIYDEVKHRPLYVVRDRINAEDARRS